MTVIVVTGLCFLWVGMLVGCIWERIHIKKSVNVARKLLNKAEAWAAYQKALKNP